MDKKNTLITILSGILACALVAILLLGLYIGGVFGKKSNDNVSAKPSVEGKKPVYQDGMTLNEFRAWLAVTYIGSFTSVTVEYDKDTGALKSTTKTYVTTHGSLSETYDKDGNLSEYTLRFIEDGRAYERIMKGGVGNNRIVDLEGAEIIPNGQSFAPGQKAMMEMMLAIIAGSTMEGSEYADFDVQFSDFNVQNGEANFVNAAGDGRMFYKDFNNTVITIPSDFSDYKSLEADVKLGKYSKLSSADGTSTASLEGFNKVFTETLFAVEIKSYEVKSEFDGAPVTKIAFYSTARRIIVPVSVTEIDGNVDDMRTITYKGTLADWAKVTVNNTNVKKAIPVVCSDGTTEIPANADASALQK